MPKKTKTAKGAIAEKILRTREARGMSKADLAREVGVSKTAIGQWEDGTTAPNRNRIAEVAKALDWALEEHDSRYVGQAGGTNMISSSASALAAFTAAMARGDIRIVDLTQTLSPDFPALVLPPELGQCAPFRIEEVSRYDERGPAWYWNNISMSEHSGTHFDAPAHWISGRDLPHNATDSIPPADFIAPAVVIDISAKAAANPDYELTLADIDAWEAANGRIPAKTWVLLRTDWSKRSPADYVNLRDDGAHTPGPSAAAIQFLVDQRNILGLGVETIGTDTGQAMHQSPPYPAHYFLHGAGRYGLQCLTNLDQLPPTGVVILAAPLKIRQGSGSPLRVLAMIDSSAGKNR